MSSKVFLKSISIKLENKHFLNVYAIKWPHQRIQKFYMLIQASLLHKLQSIALKRPHHEMTDQ